MTTNQKIELLQNENYAYTDFELKIQEIDGAIMCNCAYDQQMYNIDDIDVICYDGRQTPIAKANMCHFAKCETCGEWLCLDTDDYIVDDDGYCYHDNYSCTDGYVFWCDYHERYERCDDERLVHTRYDEALWCRDAYENHAFFSNYNDSYYSDRDFYSIRVYDQYGDYEVWTSDQASEHAYYCEQCDEYYIEDAWDFDSYTCTSCSGDGLLNSYHTSKDNGTLHFFGESRYVNPVGLGFELEIDTDYSNSKQNQTKLLRALHDRYGDRLTFERDGSLDNGFEIISAPHTKSEMALVDWSEMMKLCQEHGYTSHDNGNCGLHFHVSGYMFGATKEKQFDTIAKVIAFYEKHFDEFIKLSRRGSESSWANRYGITYDGDMNAYKNACRRVVDNKGFGRRYHAINLTNINWGNDALYKTVEFRINRGTLNINTFNASWDLIVTMIKNAKKIDWNDSDFFNPKKWFKGCKTNTYTYISKRNAFEGIFYLLQNQTETQTSVEL